MDEVLYNLKPTKLIKIVNEQLDTLHAGRDVVDLKAIVNHWTAAPGQSAFITMHYCIFVTGNAYHYFVDRDGMIYEFIKYPHRANHCGANVYTTKARERFPRYCPPTDHRIIPHNNTPNNITLGICTAVEDEEGRMTPECYNSLVLINARSAVKYGKDLNIDDDIILHSFFTDKKQCHKYFVLFPEEFIAFKQRVKYIMSIYKDSMIDEVEEYGIRIEENGSNTQVSLV